jgi:hypothetical protein
MSNLDRAGIIELLGRLGADDDETVLHAARELDRKMSEAGARWEDLIGSPTPADAGADERHAQAQPVRTAPDGGAVAAGGSAAERSETARLIERLLARKDLSSNLREELAEMKRSVADGPLDAMDSRYLRALAKRLGA